jgi:hypothetical protein
MGAEFGAPVLKGDACVLKGVKLVGGENCPAGEERMFRSSKPILPGIILFSVMWVSLPELFADSILYSQPAQAPVQEVSESDIFGSSGFESTLDLFTLTQPVSITNIQWQGSYSDLTGSGDSIATPVSTLFLVELIACQTADCTGGGLITGTVGTPAQVGETFVRSQANFDFNAISAPLVSEFFPGLHGLAIYDYSFSLNTPVNLTAGNYGLTVTPLINTTSNVVWLWNAGTGGNGLSEAVLDESFFALNFDGAFTLKGTAASSIPEPSSMFLLGSGLLGLFAAVREKLLE